MCVSKTAVLAQALPPLAVCMRDSDLHDARDSLAAFSQPWLIFVEMSPAKLLKFQPLSRRKGAKYVTCAAGKGLIKPRIKASRDRHLLRVNHGIKSCCP